MENILWFITTIGYVLVAWRLSCSGLGRAYRGLWYYVLFRAVRGLGLRLVERWPDTYGWVWLSTEPVIWALFGYAVFELSAAALRDYRGLASLSRMTLAAGLAVCLLASVATLVVDWSQSRGDFPVLLGYNMVRRAIFSTFSLYLLILAGFLVWFPVPVTRNMLLHAVLLALYSLAGTAVLFVRNLFGPSVIPQVSLARMVVATVCLAGWMCLTRNGESRPAVARPRWSLETERHLLDQLAALNASLSRSVEESAHRRK